MQLIINVVQIASGVLLITVILLQTRGAGLSTVFGGEGNIYRTKRGAEKVLFIGTIVLSVIFLGVAFLNILIKR